MLCQAPLFNHEVKSGMDSMYSLYIERMNTQLSLSISLVTDISGGLRLNVYFMAPVIWKGSTKC